MILTLGRVDADGNKYPDYDGDGNPFPWAPEKLAQWRTRAGSIPIELVQPESDDGNAINQQWIPSNWQWSDGSTGHAFPQEGPWWNFGAASWQSWARSVGLPIDPSIGVINFETYGNLPENVSAFYTWLKKFGLVHSPGSFFGDMFGMAVNFVEDLGTKFIGPSLALYGVVTGAGNVLSMLQNAVSSGVTSGITNAVVDGTLDDGLLTQDMITEAVKDGTFTQEEGAQILQTVKDASYATQLENLAPVIPDFLDNDLPLPSTQSSIPNINIPKQLEEAVIKQAIKAVIPASAAPIVRSTVPTNTANLPLRNIYGELITPTNIQSGALQTENKPSMLPLLIALFSLVNS